MPRYGRGAAGGRAHLAQMPGVSTVFVCHVSVAFFFLAEMLLTPPSFGPEVVAGVLDRCSYRVKDDVSFLEAIIVGVPKPVNHQA